MMTARFWAQTAERAIKTAAQAAVAAFAITDPNAIGFDVLAADWTAVASLAAGGALLSVLTSIISAPLGSEPGSPSLVATAKE